MPSPAAFTSTTHSWPSTSQPLGQARPGRRRWAARRVHARQGHHRPRLPRTRRVVRRPAPQGHRRARGFHAPQGPPARPRAPQASTRRTTARRSAARPPLTCEVYSDDRVAVVAGEDSALALEACRQAAGQDRPPCLGPGLVEGKRFRVPVDHPHVVLERPLDDGPVNARPPSGPALDSATTAKSRSGTMSSSANWPLADPPCPTVHTPSTSRRNQRCRRRRRTSCP
jgi:hypothetical protein